MDKAPTKISGEGSYKKLEARALAWSCLTMSVTQGGISVIGNTIRCDFVSRDAKDCLGISHE